MANNNPKSNPVGPRLNWKFISFGLTLMVLLIIAIVGANMGLFSRDSAAGETESSAQVVESESSESSEVSEATGSELSINSGPLLTIPATIPAKLAHNSEVEIAYPEEGVKGIYLTAQGMNDSRQAIMDLLDNTGLNAVVLDVKDDHGSLTMELPSENPDVAAATYPSLETAPTMAIFEEKQIYPIARITSFKDAERAGKRPDLSFQNPDGSLWKSDGGDSFLNPYNKENWEYLVDVAKGAAEVGFKDIQFDYVRFPEGFETFGDSLVYDMGDYAEFGKDSVEARQNAIADFLAYASEELAPYNVEVSADIFGYVAMVESTPGIGQNFVQIAENVDVVSSMIYPSHWGPGYFGYKAPDLEPYGVVSQYIETELALLESVENPPKTRPWLQDFTASYLEEGAYMEYDGAAVQAQIDALAEHGVHEYLLWDAANTYSPGVEY